MTIIVGVICKEGVVIGSDSSATFAVGNIRTIEQKCKKVTLINDNIILCCSGSVGLAQRFEQIIQRFWLTAQINNLSHIDIAQQLCMNAIQDFRSTNIPIGNLGACLAFYHNDNFYLCEFAPDNFNPEFKNSNMWYVSMGSGQLIVDPFLGFVRKLFWGDKQPSLNDGIFGTILALNHAIEVNPGGIGAPVQIGVLDNISKSVKILDESELAEHKQSVKDFEDYIISFKKGFSGNDHSEIPSV